MLALPHLAPHPASVLASVLASDRASDRASERAPHLPPHLAPTVADSDIPAAASTLSDAATVRHIRSALDDVAQWMTATLVNGDASGYRSDVFVNLTGWIAQARWLTTCSSGNADAESMPTAVAHALDQVASYAANLAHCYGLDPASAPHTITTGLRAS